MKIILISLLLYFELCTGYSIQKLKHKASHLTDIVHNQTEEYEIEETDNKLRFVYPKHEKPVLREIVYYHVVETPFEEDIEDTEGSDVVVTRRPFTNSHGFQFLTEDPEEIIESKDEVPGKADEEKEEKTDIEEVLNEVEENDESSIEEEENIMNEKRDMVKDSEEKASTTKAAEETTTVATVTEQSEEPSENTIATIDDEKKNARNLLFNQVRGKYQVAKVVPRHKREMSLEELPPAPTLPPLELGMLPEYIRNIISSTSKPETTTQEDELQHFNENDFKEEIEHKIQEIISSLTPQRDEDEYIYEDEDLGEEDEDENNGDKDGGHDEKAGQMRVARTYGMNLTLDRGYIWNDLISEPGMPGMSYDVGNSDNNLNQDESDIIRKPDEPETIDTEKPATETSSTEPTIVLHPTESKPIANSNQDKETENHEDKNSAEESTDKEDLEDIEVHKSKSKTLPIDEDSEHEDFEKNDNHEVNDDKVEKQDKEESETDKKHESDEKDKHLVNIKPETPVTIQELMKNEQFWKWLSEWTATYMELLIKHIKDVVEDEVSSQMKTLAAKLKKELKLEMKEYIEKHASIKLETKESRKENLNKHDANKLIIDGREVPITHNTNFDVKDWQKDHLAENSSKKENINKGISNNGILRHRKHKEDKENEKEPTIENKFDRDNNNKYPISITANNIYGNSAGSDKVTNVFIFYPHDEDIDDDKTDHDKHKETNTIFASGYNDKFEIDKRNPVLTGMKDEGTMTEQPQDKPSDKPITEVAKPNENLNKNEEESELHKKEESTNSLSEATPTTDKPSDPDKEHDGKKFESTNSPSEATPTTDKPSDPDKERDDKKFEDKTEEPEHNDNENKEQSNSSENNEMNKNAEAPATESSESKLNTSTTTDASFESKNDAPTDLPLDNKEKDNKEADILDKNPETTETAHKDEEIDKSIEKIKEGNDKEVFDKDSEKKEEKVILQA